MARAGLLLAAGLLRAARAYETWHLVDVASVFCPPASLTQGAGARPPSLAAGKPVTCSPGVARCGGIVTDGAKACTDSYAGIYGATCADTAWVQVDLGSDVSVSEVVLYSYTCQVTMANMWDSTAGEATAPRSFCGRKVELSVDGSAWVTVYDGGQDYIQETGPSTILAFEAQSARYVRVHSGRSSTETQVRFVELEVFNSAPALPEYSIGIDYTDDFDLNMPYIFTFLRTSDRQVSLTFTVEDATGAQVIAPQSVTLGPLGAQATALPTGCENSCMAPTLPMAVSSQYGSDYGSRCGAWDEPHCDTLWGMVNATLGRWCCQRWCYASRNCPDALPSSYVSGQYYSYAVCGPDAGGACRWDGSQTDPCACKNVGSVMDEAMRTKYDNNLNYGSTCQTWDMSNCGRDGFYQPDELDNWCCASWCYVDPECPTAKQSINMAELFWSEATCGNNPQTLQQCPFQKEEAVTSSSRRACTCLNVTMPAALLPATAPAGYGRTCAAHDSTLCSTVWPNAVLDIWCCKSWCYVDELCPDAQASMIWDGHFWSSLDCEVDTQAVVNCPYSDACKCTGSNTGVDFSTYPTNYGTFCNAWDRVNCAGLYGPNSSMAVASWGNSSNDWCCESWCYVSKDCPLAQKSWLADLSAAYVCNSTGEVYRASNDTCAAPASCDCLDVAVDPALLPAGYPADYGRSCRPHDAAECASRFPNATLGMWCCLSWCYVDELCSTAQPSTILPGRFYSEQACEMDAQTVVTCPHSTACHCSPNNTGTDFSRFPTNYGTACQAWDSVDCYDTWGPNSLAPIWDMTGSNDWCCNSWCYVSPDCPLAVDSDVIESLAYSYEVCNATGNGTGDYNESSDSCSFSRRLAAAPAGGEAGAEEPGLVEVEAPSEAPSMWHGWFQAPSSEEAGQERKLSAPPRRGKGGFGGSSSGRGGNSPSPAMVAYEARRRSVNRPSAAQASRRRAPSRPGTGGSSSGSNTGSNTNYNYGTNYVAPGAAHRRRRVVQGGSERRRQTAIDGKTHTAGNVGYGYTSQPMLMNNYGGHMPSQTGYGFSGANAYQSGHKPNVAMYAAGGAAAGVVAGAGAYYVYNSYYGSHQPYFRRRRVGAVQWCVVPRGKPQAGEFMECHECYRLHSFCESTSSCFGGAGCSYETPSPVNRDDLLSTGFVPRQWTPPLKVKFQSITGDDITRSQVCPPTTEAEFQSWGDRAMSFRADLFLTLTEMDRLGNTQAGNSCVNNTEYECKPGAVRGSKGTGACYADEEVCDYDPFGALVCQCQRGYCLDGAPGSPTAACHPPLVSAGRPGAWPGFALAWLLLLRSWRS